MIIILDDQPIPIKVDLTDIPRGNISPTRVRKVRTYALKEPAYYEENSLPRYVFVSEHYET